MTRITRDDATELRDAAHRLADIAREQILPLFRGTFLDTRNKLPAGFDPVTKADRAAEGAMRDFLHRERPLDGILGEEFGAKDGSSGLTWVLDPIDGTRGFISGTPTWGVLIAVSDAQGPLFGIIDQPYIGERFVGGLGRSEWHGPHGGGLLRTRSTDALAKATLFSTFPEIGSDTERAGFARVADQVQLTRYGMDCYAYALVALGQVDLVIECGLNAYDIQAPIAVIEAAGGIVTDWSGEPVHDGGNVIAAANPAIHNAALRALQG